MMIELDNDVSMIWDIRKFILYISDEAVIRQIIFNRIMMNEL